MEISEMEKKLFLKNYGFWENCIWIDFVKHSLLRREYLSLGVNMLTNSFKIWDTTEKEFFELKFFQNDRKIWKNYCREDFSSVSDSLTLFRVGVFEAAHRWVVGLFWLPSLKFATHILQCWNLAQLYLT